MTTLWGREAAAWFKETDFMMLADMQYLGTQPVPDGEGEIRLFCVVQNEALRLPYFLDYYRKLGVERFFIVNNNSHDETARVLETQADVHVFFTTQPFAEAHFGLNWLNDLLTHYGVGHWCVTADADELLIYPDCERVGLREFCACMERAGSAAMQAILLDMYSDRPMMEINYAPGQNLAAACPYFDRDYKFIKRIALPPQPPAFPPVEPIGGPRSRLFFPHQHRAGSWQRFLLKMLFRALKPLADKGWLHSWQIPHPSPQIFKVPLVKWDKGYQMITNHRINAVALSSTTGALLHFKFLNDFFDRTRQAIKHGQHYGGSIEYQRYGELLARNPNVTFMYPGSQRYGSSEDVLHAGLMRREG